ncbi:hypothetical protein GCM10011374_17640 [Kocuria dechangensis]|uniref:Uncharacterized protein n=1 Tax=Kocuria dechangensis TaxID=1176249 RepID=A0A917GSM3_9MICC|nr:hypothetical protein GCM10011374_17640 [Kocuria dechangensis]
MVGAVVVEVDSIEVAVMSAYLFRVVLREAVRVRAGAPEIWGGCSSAEP